MSENNNEVYVTQVTIDEKPQVGVSSMTIISLTNEEIIILRAYQEKKIMRTSGEYDQWTKKPGHSSLRGKNIIDVDSPPPDCYFTYSLTPRGQAVIAVLEERNMLTL